MIPRSTGAREAIGRICAQLDGLPLALELAAARVPLLGVEQIAERLEHGNEFLRHASRSVPERQRTLAETLEWSHRLLEDAEQTLFRRLAVFRGSFSLAAAEAVCADESLTDVDVLDALGALVHQSLVQVLEDQANPRYRLPATLRSYAAAKLADSGEWDATHRRHAHEFASLAGQAQVTRAGVEQTAGSSASSSSTTTSARRWTGWRSPRRPTPPAWPRSCGHSGTSTATTARRARGLSACCDSRRSCPSRSRRHVAARRRGRLPAVRVRAGHLAPGRVLELTEGEPDGAMRAVVLQRLGSIARSRATTTGPRLARAEPGRMGALGDSHGVARPALPRLRRLAERRQRRRADAVRSGAGRVPPRRQPAERGRHADQPRRRGAVRG